MNRSSVQEFEQRVWRGLLRDGIVWPVLGGAFVLGLLAAEEPVSFAHPYQSIVFSLILVGLTFFGGLFWGWLRRVGHACLSS